MKKTVLSLSVIVIFALYVVATLSKGNPAAPPSGNNINSIVVSQTSGQSIAYKDGQYTGNVADAYYGNIQVQATIQGGKISDVVFLDYPQDRRNSVRINTEAMPLLKSEAIQAQSAQVDIVSGATATSDAFRQSLASALAQA